MKIIANRKPPRPWFHERLKLSGYAIRVKRIGKTRTIITAKLDMNVLVAIILLYQDLLLSERACFNLFLLNKRHGLDGSKIKMYITYQIVLQLFKHMKNTMALPKLHSKEKNNKSLPM
jgi:hypothetical protein